MRPPAKKLHVLLGQMSELFDALSDDADERYDNDLAFRAILLLDCAEKDVRRALKSLKASIKAAQAIKDALDGPGVVVAEEFDEENPAPDLRKLN